MREQSKEIGQLLLETQGVVTIPKSRFAIMKIGGQFTVTYAIAYYGEKKDQQ
jgi:hypothetical protein